MTDTMQEKPTDWLMGSGSRGRAIIKSVLNDHSLHPDDFFSTSRIDYLVEARIDAAKRMRARGYSHSRIADMLCRERSTIGHYLNPDLRVVKRNRLRQTRAVKLLAPDTASFVLAFANAEQITPEMLIAQWVTERASHEAESRARGDFVLHFPDGVAAPQRIQRKRVKDFDMQAVSVALNGLPCVSVTRPGRHGNPFRVGVDGTAQECVDKYREEMPEFAKEAYRQELRGKNLACFCALDQLCHADVLLEIANAPVPS